MIGPGVEGVTLVRGSAMALRDVTLEAARG